MHKPEKELPKLKLMKWYQRPLLKEIYTGCQLFCSTEIYSQALESVAATPDSKTIMMPLEASNLLGSIAGISELAKGGDNKPDDA